MDLKETIEYIENRSGKISKYSDTLREAVKQLDYHLVDTFKTAGIVYLDKEPFYNGRTERYYLKISKYHGDGEWGIMCVEEDYANNDWIGDAPRYLVKAAVTRLPEFLQAYADELNTKTEEYREISEIAEKMLENIKKEE